MARGFLVEDRAGSAFRFVGDPLEPTGTVKESQAIRRRRTIVWLSS